MEEKTMEDDVIYDLTAEEHAESAEGQGAQESSEESENSENCMESENTENCMESANSENSAESANSAESENTENTEDSENSENADNGDNTGNADNTDPHQEEIERMIEEMGAETLLSIIKDNRNAAIRQIISEVEASRHRDMPTGSSASSPCSSIFDLAALA